VTFVNLHFAIRAHDRYLESQGTFGRSASPVAESKFGALRSAEVSTLVADGDVGATGLEPGCHI
jgi:hypothetical protein